MESLLLRRTLIGHTGPVSATAVSPDWAFLVSASEDGTLKVWDAASGEVLHTLGGHQGPVYSCAFSPDAAFLVSAGADGTLKVWDAESGQELQILEGHTEAVYGCAISPDGAIIVSASVDRTLKLWDTASGRELRTLFGHNGVVYGCAVSPVAGLVASMSADGTLKLWDSSSGENLNTLEGHAGPVYGCAFSPNAELVVSASADATLKVWDTASARQLHTLEGHTDAVYCCAVGPDGAVIASASADMTLKLWNAVSGRELRTLEGLTGRVVACALRPGEAFIASAAEDDSLKIWDARVTTETAETAQLRETDLVPMAQRPAESTPEPYLDENVQFTVYRPQAIVPEKWYDLLAFAHLSDLPPDAEDSEPHPLAEVQRQARQVLGVDISEYLSVTQDSVKAVPRSGELTFVPEIEGIEFNPLRRSFLWLESVHREEFRLRAGLEVDSQALRGRLTVFLGSVILADIPLTIRVDRQYATGLAPIPMAVETARPYRKIFASYSHEDSWIVDEFDGYARAFGDEYLRDVVTLRAGEVWSPRLEELIREADVFQLFWSWNSMDSPFVQQEWKHALTLERPHFVRPVYWDEPLPVRNEVNLPPETLRRLHFQRIAASRSPERTEPPERRVVRSEGWPVEPSTPRRRLPAWAVHDTGADSHKRWGGDGGGSGRWEKTKDAAEALTPAVTRSSQAGEVTQGVRVLRQVFGVLAIAAAMVGGVITYKRTGSVWAAVFVGLIVLHVVARAIPHVITDSVKVRHALFLALGPGLAAAIFYFSYQAWETGWLSFVLGIVGGAILREVLAPLLVFCLFPAIRWEKS